MVPHDPAPRTATLIWSRAARPSPHFSSAAALAVAGFLEDAVGAGAVGADAVWVEDVGAEDVGEACCLARSPCLARPRPRNCLRTSPLTVEMIVLGPPAVRPHQSSDPLLRLVVLELPGLDQLLHQLVRQAGPGDLGERGAGFEVAPKTCRFRSCRPRYDGPKGATRIPSESSSYWLRTGNRRFSDGEPSNQGEGPNLGVGRGAEGRRARDLDVLLRTRSGNPVLALNHTSERSVPCCAPIPSATAEVPQPDRLPPTDTVRPVKPSNR